MISKRQSSIITVLIIILAAALMFTETVQAEALLESTEGAEFSDNCIEGGDCQVRDFTVLLIRISQILLGLTGSLSLLAFVYGGSLFLLSGGNKERIEKGKSTLIGAVIGIFIVFASFTIIGFVFSAFQIEGSEQWATSNWFN